MKNLHKVKLGPLMTIQDTHWAHPCIIVDVKKKIIATSSECILDTLKFSPHNSPMPQLSSTDRPMMADNDMTDALKHHHPDGPFNPVGDDTIKALTTLSAIFKNNYNKHPVPELIDSPLNAAENKRPVVLIQSMLTSPVKHTYQTR
jgi:hypothetical protein